MLVDTGKLKPEDARPDLSGWDFLLTSYAELDTCRSMSGQIPLTAIWQYVDRYGLSDEIAHLLMNIDKQWNMAKEDKKERTDGRQKRKTRSRAPR